MKDLRALDEAERTTERSCQRRRIVTRHPQTTALRRTFQCEGGKNQTSAGLNCLPSALEVRLPPFLRCEEVKYGPIMPDVIVMLWKFGMRYVSRDPMDEVGTLAERLFCRLQGCCGDIEDGNVPVSACEQILGKGGLTSANIDDGGRIPGLCPRDECQRCFQVRRVPTHGLRSLRAVDGFPMCLGIHALEDTLDAAQASSRSYSGE